MARSEYEAAYFTLLRAQEERDALLRYREFLQRERERLEGFTADTQIATDGIARGLRRAVESTTRGLLEAVGRRRTVVLSELNRMDERLANAEAFVSECEADVQSLRRS